MNNPTMEPPRIKAFEFEAFQRAYFTALGNGVGFEFFNAFLRLFGEGSGAEEAIQKSLQEVEKYNRSTRPER